MAEAPAAGSSAEVKWFFLDGNSQHIGPYDAATMQGGFASLIACANVKVELWQDAEVTATFVGAACTLQHEKLA